MAFLREYARPPQQRRQAVAMAAQTPACDLLHGPGDFIKWNHHTSGEN